MSVVHMVCTIHTTKLFVPLRAPFVICLEWSEICTAWKITDLSVHEKELVDLIVIHYNQLVLSDAHQTNVHAYRKRYDLSDRNQIYLKWIRILSPFPMCYTKHDLRHIHLQD